MCRKNIKRCLLRERRKKRKEKKKRNTPGRPLIVVGGAGRGRAGRGRGGGGGGVSGENVYPVKSSNPGTVSLFYFSKFFCFVCLHTAEKQRRVPGWTRSFRRSRPLFLPLLVTYPVCRPGSVFHFRVVSLKEGPGPGACGESVAG